MSSGLPGSLLFATHLLGLLVAAGATFSLFLERGRSFMSRLLGAAGFAALASAEVIHGAGFVGETDPIIGWIRTGGYVLILLGALLPTPTVITSVPALVVLPGDNVTPFVAASLAAVASAWRRRGERGSLWLAVGLLLLGASDLVLGFETRSWANEVSHVLRVAGYIAVARIVVAFARHSIRFRFIVGFSSLLVAVVLFVSVAIGTVIDRNLREGALQRVEGQGTQALLNLENRAVTRVNALVALARGLTPDIEAGLRISDETLEEYRNQFLPDIDFIILFDRTRQVRGALDEREGDDIELAGTDVVEDSLRDGQPAASLDAVGERLALLGVAPIPSSRGAKPAGLAIAGFDLDRELLRGEIGGAQRVMAFLGSRGGPPTLAAAAGFPTFEPEIPPATLARLGDSFKSFLVGGPPGEGTLRFDGEDHFASITPLRTRLGPLPQGDDAVGLLVVAEPAAVLAETQAEVNQVLFLITVAVIGLAFGLALIAARRITRPLVTLTGAARRVSAGDLDAKAEVGGEDEVADLAIAFNRMTDSVTGMTEELRLAATEQSQLRARLETVVNSMGDGLIAVDDDGRVVTYNPAAGSIVGIPRSRVVGKQLREVLKGRDERGRRLLSRGATPSGIAFVGRPDGKEVPVAITSSPLKDGQGARLGRVYVLRDMSSEHEVERMKREFLSNVSHELRTPLTPIIGYSELMTKRDVPIEKAREFAVSILDSGRRLERIVAMLVDFSAIEAGRMALDLEPTSLGPLVKEGVEKAQERNPKHRFTSRVARGVPPALVSSALFRRMLSELLDNAVKYSPKGGKVTASVDMSPARGRRMLEVAVTDQGIGIEQENLAGVFQDFRQVDASDTRPFGGLGLGLTFVKRIAEAHGGSISAESKAGKGSTFRFTVPSADISSRRSK